MIACECPHCGKHLNILDKYAGKTGQCKGCGNLLTVPTLAQAAAAVQPPPRPVEPAKPPLNAAQSLETLNIDPDKPLPKPVAPLEDETAPTKKAGGFFGPEKQGIEKGVLGGMIMMGIAVAWFVGGMLFGFIFFYPPILFVIGLFAFLKGLVTGNLAGK